MNRKLPLIALSLLTGSLPVAAVTPSSGVWWNPDASGSGYEIDRQGSTMTLAIYAYDDTGAPLWYLVAGDYDDDTSTFSGSGSTFTGGQCLGCDYTSPVATPAGDFSLTFTDSEHGTLSFPGGSTPIEHFNYGYASKQDYLLGEWVFTAYGPTSDTTTAGTSIWIVFDSHAAQADGSVLVTGHADGAPDTTATGRYDPTDDTFTVVIDGTTLDDSGHDVTYESTYQLQGDDRSMTGSVTSGGFFLPSPTLAAAFRLRY